jgi:hypothetical protein
MSATGAAASVGVSYINTQSWSALFLGPTNQTVTNTGIVSNGVIAGNNVVNPTPISVGSLSGTGASVRASAAGAVASISVTSILSLSQQQVPAVGVASVIQTATNNGGIINSASIVSTGTLSGMGSSATIAATGAATSVSVASINDTTVLPPPMVTIPTITQTSTNTLSPVINSGSITLAGGNLGVGAAASIGAVGASASVSFLAIK